MFMDYLLYLFQITFVQSTIVHSNLSSTINHNNKIIVNLPSPYASMKFHFSPI